MGKLIVVESVEQSVKIIQIKRLAKYLKNCGYKVSVFHNYSQALLPELKRGKIVVCAEGPVSGVAYRGYSDALDPGEKGISLAQMKERESLLEYRLNKIRRENKEETRGIEPDLTIFLDANPQEKMRRVHMGFLQEGLRYTKSGRWRTIWADDDPEIIHQKIVQIVQEKLGL